MPLEKQVLPVPLGQPGRKVSKAQRVLQGLRVVRVRPVPREVQVPQVQLARKVFKAQQALQVPRALPVPQEVQVQQERREPLARLRRLRPSLQERIRWALSWSGRAHH